MVEKTNEFVDNPAGKFVAKRSADVILVAAAPAEVEEKVVKSKAEIAARSKELKAMAIDDLKELVDRLGLGRATKIELVEAVLDHEAKVRSEQQAGEASTREVVVEKTEEFVVPAMAKMCAC